MLFCLEGVVYDILWLANLEEEIFGYVWPLVKISHVLILILVRYNDMKVCEEREIVN